MTQPVSVQLIKRIHELINQKTGLHFSASRIPALIHAFDQTLANSTFDSFEAFFDHLVNETDPDDQTEILANHLTIGETYFYRNTHINDALEQVILPELIAPRRLDHGGDSLNLWSAGCSTGEEPYSLAIMLDRLLTDPGQFKINILGTDINRLVLQKAEIGLYGEWSFRNAPSWLKPHYFLPVGKNKFQLKPHIMNRVRFNFFNLVESPPRPLLVPVHIIMCQNVLMYFDTNHIRRVIELFSHILAPGGWLIVSPSEHVPVIREFLEQVRVQDVFLYRKQVSPADRVEGAISRRSPPRKPLPVDPSIKPLEEHRQLSPTCYSLTKPSPIAVEQVPHIRESHSLGAPLSEPPTQSELADDQTACYQLIQQFADQGDYNTALTLCQQQLVIDKLDPELYFLRAGLYQATGKDEDALADLKRVLYLVPNHIPAHLMIGSLYHHLSQPQSAQKHFFRARALVSQGTDDTKTSYKGTLSKADLDVYLNLLSSLWVATDGEDNDD